MPRSCRRARTPVAVVIIGVSIAACSSSSKPTGDIVGALRMTGGITGGISIAVPGDVYAFSDPSFAGKPSAHAKANRAGQFKLELRPGTYYLAATSPRFTITPKPPTPPCHGERPAVVTTATTIRDDIACAMK